jgi:hypothetical protein
MMFNTYESGVGEGPLETAAKVVFPVHFIANMPIIGKVFGAFGIGKKATHMESCMKGMRNIQKGGAEAGFNKAVRAPIEYFVPYVGGAGSLMPLNLEDQLKKAGIRYTVARDIAKAEVNKILAGRQARLNRKFYDLAHQYDEQMDLFAATCASQPQGRAETGMSAEQAAQVEALWNMIRQQAALDEYNETVGMIENVLSKIVKNMEEVQERGTVTMVAAKRAAEKGEVSPTKATFRYTKSGMPLVTLGCCRCGE